METTGATPDEARTFTLAVDDAVGAVEELLRRPKEQKLFESAQVLAVLDRAERVGTLAASVESDDAARFALAEVCAGGRAKATSQPVIDAASVKGGLLLDLWEALRSLRRPPWRRV